MGRTCRRSFTNRFANLIRTSKLHLAFCPGVALHDIRFRGSRIVYELALQDQFVSYSGYAGEGQIFYLDSYYGLGTATAINSRDAY